MFLNWVRKDKALVKASMLVGMRGLQIVRTAHGSWLLVGGMGQGFKEVVGPSWVKCMISQNLD